MSHDDDDDDDDEINKESERIAARRAYGPLSAY